jgi:hypothetical protein
MFCSKKLLIFKNMLKRFRKREKNDKPKKTRANKENQEQK